MDQLSVRHRKASVSAGIRGFSDTSSLPARNLECVLSNSVHRKEQGVNQYGHIHEECAVANVVKVILDVLVDLVSPISAKLPQPRNSWDDLMSLPVPRTISPHDEGHLRPRTHHRHVTKQDIHQLRQLVEACPPQNPSKPRNSRVSWRGGRHAIFGGASKHRAELVHIEDLFIAAHPFLHEDGWPWRIPPDQ
jgi:hypothetical protein